MPKLTYTVSGQERTVDVTDSCSIGRLPENAVPLPDEEGASRRHCQILKIAGGYEVSDLGSTNGTRVNGERVKRRKLKHGDRIQIGETELVWSDAAAGRGDGGGEEEVVLEGDVDLEEPGGAPKHGAAAAAATGEQCYLVFAGGARDGERIALEKKRITFGRNPKNTCAFADDPGVSGYHCEICREGGAYVLRDLGSTNGTMVDGEQVTEVALQHGNRIRFGGQRVVFVDPSISDFEKAMASVEDLGSEWGLLRAEMDMTRVQRARRSQIVAVVAVLVVLAGAGYVAVAHPELLAGGEPQPAAIAGNTLPDFSFEGRSAQWAPAADSPAVGRYAEAADGRAAQGRTFYAVSRDGAPGRGAAVALVERVRPNPEKPYAFGAKVRTSGDAQACVRVVWVSSDDTTVVGESATDLVAAADWTEVRGAVARPPRDTAVARIELVNAAGGTAFFDDVFLAGAASAPPTFELRFGEVSAESTADGQVTVRRGSTVLLGALSVVGGALPADGGDAARRSDRVGSRKGTTVAPGRVSGQSFDALRGRWTPFSVQVAVAEDRYVDLSAELDPDAGLLATLPGEFVAEGISVQTEGSNFRIGEARVVDKVRAVRFGQRNLFEVAAAPDAPSFRFALVRSGDGWLAGFGGAGLSLRIDTDTKALTAELDRLRDELRTSRAARRHGESVQLLRKLVSLLPAGSPEAADAAKDADRLESEAEAEMEKIRQGRAASTEFRDATDLGALSARAATLAQQYKGHPVAQRAEEEIAAIRKALDDRLVVLRERRAAPMVARAEDCRDRGDYAVGSAICRGVVDAYPGTAAAAKARELLAEIEKLAQQAGN